MASWEELTEQGRALYMAGDYVRSSHALREACEARPDSIETWRALGFALAASGNPPDAIGAFRRALELAPGDVDAHFGMGTVQSESGDVAGAIEWFDKALALKPGHARAKASLVAALVKQGLLSVRAGQRAAASASFERAVKLAPASPETVLPHTENLMETGRFKEAYDIANSARKLNPNDAKLRELFETVDADPRVARAKRENSLI
jgi:Flp pilus assembly protein TadD